MNREKCRTNAGLNFFLTFAESKLPLRSGNFYLLNYTLIFIYYYFISHLIPMFLSFQRTLLNMAADITKISMWNFPFVNNKGGNLRSALLWDITKSRGVILYRRFGTTCRSHLQRIFNPWRWDRLVVPKCRYGMTTLSCVTSQKLADIICMAAKSWNHVGQNALNVRVEIFV